MNAHLWWWSYLFQLFGFFVSCFLWQIKHLTNALRSRESCWQQLSGTASFSCFRPAAQTSSCQSSALLCCVLEQDLQHLLHALAFDPDLWPLTSVWRRWRCRKKINKRGGASLQRRIMTRNNTRNLSSGNAARKDWHIFQHRSISRLVKGREGRREQQGRAVRRSLPG